MAQHSRAELGGTAAARAEDDFVLFCHQALSPFLEVCQISCYIVSFFQDGKCLFPCCTAGLVVGLVEDGVEFPRADAFSPARIVCQQLCQQSGRQGRLGRHGQQGAGRFEAEADVLQWFSHRRQPGCRQHDVA